MLLFYNLLFSKMTLEGTLRWGSPGALLASLGLPGALGPHLDPGILVLGACLQSAAFLIPSLKQTGHFWLPELPGPFWPLEGTLCWSSSGALLGLSPGHPWACLGLPGAPWTPSFGSLSAKCCFSGWVRWLIEVVGFTFLVL